MQGLKDNNYDFDVQKQQNQIESAQDNNLRFPYHTADFRQDLLQKFEDAKKSVQSQHEQTPKSINQQHNLNNKSQDQSPNQNLSNANLFYINKDTNLNPPQSDQQSQILGKNPASLPSEPCQTPQKSQISLYNKNYSIHEAFSDKENFQSLQNINIIDNITSMTNMISVC